MEENNAASHPWRRASELLSVPARLKNAEKCHLMSTKPPYFRGNAETAGVVVPGVCSVTHICKQEEIPFALWDIPHCS